MLDRLSLRRVWLTRDVSVYMHMAEGKRVSIVSVIGIHAHVQY